MHTSRFLGPVRETALTMTYTGMDRIQVLLFLDSSVKQGKDDGRHRMKTSARERKNSSSCHSPA